MYQNLFIISLMNVTMNRVSLKGVGSTIHTLARCTSMSYLRRDGPSMGIKHLSLDPMPPSEASKASQVKLTLRDNKSLH